MRFDKAQYDAALCLCHIQHPGRFAIEITPTTGRAIRIASPLNAHVDALLASALLMGLAALKKQGIANGSRILISSDVLRFVERIRTNNLERLSAPQLVRERLKHELQEFAFTFEHNSQPIFHIALSNWLYKLPLGILDDLQGWIEQPI
jgi:hypothetical protein